MTSQIFTYLKRKGYSDPAWVNALFVSAFVRHNGWDVSACPFLMRYVMAEDCKELQEFREKLARCGCDFTLEDLSRLFEFVISPEDRVITGAIYTPKEVRTLILTQVFSHFSKQELSHLKVGDIACGCGAFLMDVAELLHERTERSFMEIFSQQIYGVDIQEYSVERTKIMLALLAVSHGETGEMDFNIVQGDSVKYDFRTLVGDNGFDVIVGNPPYVCSRNMSAETKAELWRWSVCATGHPDLYRPFCQIALENLRDGGVLGYITMNSFIKSLNGRALRQYFQNCRFDFRLIDFRSRQIFGSKSTYTCVCIIQKTEANGVRYGINITDEITVVPVFHDVPYSSLDAKRGWNLENTVESAEIESKGTPLGKYCQSRHGIATLSNKTYIFKPIREDEAYFYFMKDGKEWHVERGICRDIVNSNRMTKEVRFEDVLEKCIFPYTDDDQPRVLEENVFRELYPEAYRYLSSCRKALYARDKGKGRDYAHWYEFGRTQCLNRMPAKLFFPKLASHSPHCVLSEDRDLLFYNGQAFISDDIKKLKRVKKIIESSEFWRYIQATSKPYASGYYSLNGNYIKNYGVE